jgi:uncharacterized protein (DUF488 family)
LKQKTIYTIGHSTRSIEELHELLDSFKIALLADIRHYPGSRKYPHFNKENLEQYFPGHGIDYRHLIDLGGRRRPKKDTKNTAWRVEAFRGYADYMETREFKLAVTELEKMAKKKNTAYMCSEAVWWSCHRALVSDYLKAKGWTVLHIMQHDKAAEHPYTAPAKVTEGKLSYHE